MPDISKATLRQRCVVWKAQDTKTRHGQVRVASPITAKCRWLTNDQAGPSQEKTEESYPRNLMIDQWIPLGSYLWGPGRLADLPSSPQYYEVINSQKFPDIKGRNPAYRVTLQKASKTLPTLA